MGGRKPCRFTPVVAGLLHPFGLPPYVGVCAAVVHLAQLEINMTDLFTSAPAQVTPFTFGTHAVRVIDRDGSPWFVAADVCSALGYQNSRKAVADHLDADERCNQPLHRGGELTIISESGLYALVLRSRKPEARKFAKWVTSEVLPAIRKTGGYQQPTNVAHALEVANKVASMVQQSVFEHVLNGGDNWRNDRFLFGFTYGRKDEIIPYAHTLETNAMAMSLARLAAAIVEPNGMMPSNTELANLAAACNQRLAQRMEYQANQKAVTA